MRHERFTRGAHFYVVQVSRRILKHGILLLKGCVHAHFLRVRHLVAGLLRVLVGALILVDDSAQLRRRWTLLQHHAELFLFRLRQLIILLRPREFVLVWHLINLFELST